MAKLKRSYYALFLNVGKWLPESTATDSWYRIGKDLEDASMELNHDTEIFKNILDQAVTTDKGYEPSYSVDTFYADTGDALYTKLKRVISERLTGSDLDVEILEVWMDQIGTPGSTPHTALKSKAAISVESYGGDTGGVNIPFTLTQNGEVTPGTATMTAAFVPSFTPTA